jgi:16S rRNA (uracil1498-N3)-methyltransferase
VDLPLVRAAVRRFRVPALPAPGERLPLDAAASHHLLHVCRHPRGARLVVFDGAGSEVEVALADVDGVAVIEGLGPPRSARPRHALHLVLALPKGPALDAALRMAVETGATHLHPALSERTIARGERPDRWERILASAAQQCGRADVPLLAPLLPLAEAAAAVPAGADRRVAVPGAERLAASEGDAAVAIGPEGGLTAREVDRLLAAGWAPMGLGEWVLRVDTAVAVALASARG